MQGRVMKTFKHITDPTNVNIASVNENLYITDPTNENNARLSKWKPCKHITDPTNVNIASVNENLEIYYRPNKWKQCEVE